jgi:cell cycle sensor histidine kinase DivJ
LGAGIQSGSQRFVSERAPAEERPAQQRFVATLLMGPFLLALVWVVAAAANLHVQATVAALLALFVPAWSCVAFVNWSASLKPAATVMLAVAAMLMAWTIAASGGFSSPVLLLSLAFAPECWWIFRTRQSFIWGAAATIAIWAGVVAIQAVAGTPATSFAVWHWLIPGLYMLAAAPRLISAINEMFVSRALGANPDVEDMIDAAILRFEGAGDIIEVGGKSEEFFGVAAPFLLGGGLFDRIHVGDRVTYMHALSGLSNGESRHCCVRIRMPADEAGNVFFRPALVEIHDGEPGVMVLRDDSVADDMRRTIADLQRQLAEGEMAKARFLATVSHELRTPLNAIIGFSDMMAQGLAGQFADPRQAEYTRIIRESGNHLLAVVNAILDISRIESRAYSIRCEPFRFAEAAFACHEMLTMQAREKLIEFRNEVSPDIGEINGDRRAIQQVLINLISNAIKFTPQGGTVCMAARLSGPHLVFQVSDNGIGIDQDDLERLGRPFVQLRNDYAREQDGVGLGLSIAKGLVALHDGAMTIASAPGAGTTVSVKLPLKGPSISAPGLSKSGEEGASDAVFRQSA